MRSGFSLVQISILLTVASLLMVTVLPTAKSSLDTNSLSMQRMNTVLQTLRQFEVANGRLPCPADASKPIGDTTYGKEAAGNSTSSNCGGGSPAANYIDATNHVAIGMVPVKALALPNDYAYDAYGRHLTYAVDTNATVCGWSTTPQPGTITVTDNAAANKTVVTLVSHGKDGHGAWIPLPGSSGTAVRLNTGSADANQLTNAHVDASFAATSALNNFVITTPSATFDDLVTYKSPVWSLSQLPSNAPRVSSVSPPANGNYKAGQALTFILTYNLAVTVTGTPRLVLTALGGAPNSVNGGTAYANYVSGSGTTTLTFTYTAQNADSAMSGLSLASSVDMNGGTIKNGSLCAYEGFTSPDLSLVKIGYYVYVADTGNNRIQIFDSSGNFVSKFGTAGSGDGQFSSPSGIYVDASNIYVTDYGNNRVQKFDLTGTYVSQFAVTQPTAITKDGSGNFWIGYNGGSIYKYNSAGSLQATYGTWGSSNGQLYVPYGLAFDTGGNIWATNTTDDRIQKFDSSGAYVTKFNGATGSYFANIGFDSGGYMWAATTGSGTVKKFNAGTGATLLTAGSYSATPAAGQFDRPYGLAVDIADNVWVVDFGGHLQKISNSGTFLLSVGSSGSGDGQFNNPKGVAAK